MDTQLNKTLHCILKKMNIVNEIFHQALFYHILLSFSFTLKMLAILLTYSMGSVYSIQCNCNDPGNTGLVDSLVNNKERDK